MISYKHRNNIPLAIVIVLIMSFIGIVCVISIHKATTYYKVNKDSFKKEQPLFNVIIGGELAEFNYNRN